ncbi:hypothetical protein NKJ84_26725 [Mesorhizobium sp. M0048]|uniref:hypothetical protein n=1 Tax=Mesorhizobium sp. M0048 TaxID=2956860 RepID=UPI00333A5213
MGIFAHPAKQKTIRPIHAIGDFAKNWPFKKIFVFVAQKIAQYGAVQTMQQSVTSPFGRRTFRYCRPSTHVSGPTTGCRGSTIFGSTLPPLLLRGRARTRARPVIDESIVM